MPHKEPVAPFVATLELRIAVPEGTHMPDQQKLQQMWVAVTAEGVILKEWRDVPRVLVQKGKEHE
jgi:hypothetical protein